MKSRKERKYCSRQCSAKAHEGENNNSWGGGRKVIKERQKKDLKYQLNQRIGGLIRSCIKRGSKNSRHWENLIGYTVYQLKKRLQQTMPEGYCWQDFLGGKLHIDHIIPVRAFTFETPEDEEFKQCWNLHNLRLLPDLENLSKHDSITNPILLGLLLKQEKSFQPALAI